MCLFLSLFLSVLANLRPSCLNEAGDAQAFRMLLTCEAVLRVLQAFERV